ncbi:MAG: hypothetical protein ACREXX_05055 [Gammaproteobacteria bacterium]
MNRDMLSAAGLPGPFAVDGAEGITAMSSKPAPSGNTTAEPKID